MVDSIKRASTPKPVEPTPAPKSPAATTPAAQATPASTFTRASETPVALTVPQEQVSTGVAPIRVGAGLSAGIGQVKDLVSDVKKDLSGLVGSFFGPRAADAPENQAVTREMTPEERSQYNRLSEEDRTTFNEAHLTAQQSQDPAEVEKLETALVSGAMPEYLELSPEERERVDKLYADTAQLPEDQQEAARAQVANLVKEGKVADYMTVEQASSEDANLQALLFNGQLNGTADDGGETMLDYLAGTANGPETTGQGLSRGELLDQIINDVHNPEYSQPEGNRDCLPLAAVSEFARRNPASYARMMTELGETGTTTLTKPNGESVELHFQGPPNSTEGLTATQEMFIESVGDYIDREFGRGEGGGLLARALGGLMDMFDGMTSQEASELLDLTMGADYEAMTIPDDEEIDRNDPEQAAEQQRLRDAAKDTIREQLDAGEQPLVNIDGHWVKVTNTLEFAGMTIYVIDNGTGQPSFASANQVDSVVFNTEHSDVPPNSYNSEWDDPGTGLKPGQGIGGDD